MGLGGRHADEELGGDLGVRTAVGDQREDLLLASGEGQGTFRFLSSSPRSSSVRGSEVW